jgi:galactonate dehydratase
MKIADVESMILGGAHLVRITTDTGIVGLGQSACWGYPDASHAMLQTFRRHLIGEDPLRIEHHWQYLYRMGAFRGSVLSGAVSAVDIALWDIKGQHLQVPIWELLGGKVRDRIRLYLLLYANSAEEVAQRVKAAAEDGFTAVKFDPIPAGYGDLTQEALVAEVAERVAAAREVAKRDVDIMIELHRKLTPLQALPIIEAMAPFRPFFVEDAIQIDSIVSQAEIARRVSTPIANGERLHSIWEFRELLVHGGSQYVRPDVGLAGGLTHCKKIAAIAESFHAAVVTHNFLGPILTAASVHLDTSIPNFVVQEYTVFDEAERWGAVSNAVRREGGYLIPPEVPGLGVTLLDDQTTEWLAPAHAARIHETPLRADGSVMHAV